MPAINETSGPISIVLMGWLQGHCLCSGPRSSSFFSSSGIVVPKTGQAFSAPRVATGGNIRQLRDSVPSEVVLARRANSYVTLRGKAPLKRPLISSLPPPFQARGHRFAV